MTSRTGVDENLAGDGKIIYAYDAAGRATTVTYPLTASEQWKRAWRMMQRIG